MTRRFYPRGERQAVCLIVTLNQAVSL